MIDLWKLKEAHSIAIEKEKELGDMPKQEKRLMFLYLVHIYNIEEQSALNDLAKFVYGDAEEFQCSTKSWECHLVKDNKGNICCVW